MVRVVVLDYDGGDLTVDCLSSLVATDWPRDRLEIVLVDNGSRHRLKDRVGELPERVRIVRSDVNLGFAGGNNLALRDLAGIDYVALLNNDATVEPGWLAPLVETLATDAALGAACPKIVFAGRFLDLELRSETHRPGRGDRRDVGVRLSGVRVDGRDAWRTALLVPSGYWGPEPEIPDEPGFEWTAARAEIRMPSGDGAPPRAGALRLGADRPTRVTITSGGARTEQVVPAGVGWYETPLGGVPFDVVNNVGSELVADGYGADRGYLERDAGQYDTEEDVFAWCGAAVLLRTGYLADVGLFDERLFLYSEDLELSWRGSRRGWRYRYVPESVVRHVHSATTVEGSTRAEHYKERNHLAVLTRHGSRSLLARALVRYILVTASYARRDVALPLLRGRRPQPEIVGRRMRAFFAYLRLAPAMLLARRRR
ncbi:MAG: glycosyltransferase [Actinomycetota bacterium]